MQLDFYQKLASVIRKYTSQNRVATTNRLIASLQPNLLCTIVNNGKLTELVSFLNHNFENCDININSSWFEKVMLLTDSLLLS
jgi:5-methylcytosine-specific restriction enzyme B